MAIKVVCAALVVLSCLVLIRGDLSLTSTALVQERKYYESTLDNAAQAVLRKLNKDKAIASSSRISKVDLEDTQVAESVLYSIGVEMDLGAMRGVSYEMKFVQPLSPWHSVRAHSALPPGTARAPSTAVALQGTAPTYAPPEISLTLNGPLELFFPHPTTEISIKTPKYVDIGFVDRVIVAEGANITLSGPVELRLRDTIAVDADLVVEEGKIVINTKDRPRINVYGHRIEISNSSASESLKVQKKSSSTVEISAQGAVINTGRVPLEIALNDSRIETIKYILQQLSDSAKVAFPPKIRRISSGSSMEAVVSFMIPMELEDKEAGTSDMYNVIVAQGSNHKEAQVISIEKQKPRNEVTWVPALAVNGTLPDAIQNFQQYLQDTGRVF